MQNNIVTNIFSVSPQIEVLDIAEIKKLGFKSIVCNRPDNEENGQANYESIKTEADKNNLEIKHLPFSGVILDETIVEMKQLLEILPTPVIAYCRTGTRSICLWSQTQLDTMSKSDILNLATDAGYDVFNIVG